MSIGYKTPEVAHTEQGLQKRMWKRKVYRPQDGWDEKDVISLQGE